MTATTSPRTVERSALLRPQTADETNRSVELVIATAADVGDGVVLRIDPAAVGWPPVVPVLLDHMNQTDRMAGRIEALRFDAGQLIGRAVFADAPAADAGWQLARAGVAVSVGAQILETRPLGRSADEATRWNLRHVALTPQGQDPAAFTRSQRSLSEPMTAANITAPTEGSTTTADAPQDVQRSAAEIRRERDILRAAQAAGLDTEQTDELIRGGRPIGEVHVRIYEILRDRLSQSTAGHPARGPKMDHTGDGLAQVLERKLGGDASDGPLASVLRDHLRVSEYNPTKVIERAFSTSDFVTALTSSAERTLLTAYQEAPEGVRSLALSRELTDFRAVKMLRVSQFGAVGKVLEGGEYQAQSFSEEDAATLQAAQYGGIAVLTRVALANDDLDIFGRLITEMGRSAARKEASELAARLADISWTAANSLSGQGDLDIDAVAAAVLLLRRQTDVNGNKVSFDPDLLVIAPEQEKQARQMLGSYQPASPSNVNPFSTLRLEVDHNLAGGTAYLADSRYRPLGIGRVGAGPSILREEEFSTGSIRLRVAHDFGTCKLDGRSIVKIGL